MAQQLRKQHSSTKHSCTMFTCTYMPYSYLQAVKNNDVEAVQLLLDSLSPHTGYMAAVQEEVTQYTSDKGWNVFHYAAYYHSVEITEQLVTFLKGNIIIMESLWCSCAPLAGYGTDSGWCTKLIDVTCQDNVIKYVYLCTTLYTSKVKVFIHIESV